MICDHIEDLVVSIEKWLSHHNAQLLNFSHIIVFYNDQRIGRIEKDSETEDIRSLLVGHFLGHNFSDNLALKIVSKSNTDTDIMEIMIRSQDNILKKKPL